ncbi:MAG: hypothetical protein ACR2K1_09810, partial [Saprospiraceae bacterium]
IDSAIVGSVERFSVGISSGNTVRFDVPQGGISGSGTTNTIPKFTASTTLGNSLFTDDGSVTAAGGIRAFQVPNGTTGERPGTALNGQVRYNTTNSALEYFDGQWEVPLLTDNATTGLETAGRVLIAKASGKAGSNAGFRYDETYNTLINAESTNVLAADTQQKMLIQNGSNNAQVGVEVNGDPPTRRGVWTTVRSRGTNEAKTLVSSGDEVGRFQFGGWDGTDYETSSFIGAILSGTPANNNIPIDIYFTTGIQTGNRFERMRVTAGGNVGIGLTAPTAALHLKAGTATANSAPLKFTSGTNLTTAEAGAMEYNGTNLLFTPSTVRHTVNHGLTGSATLDFPSTGAQNSSDLTITVTGASDGDVVGLGVPNAAITANSCYTAWVSASNTVTIRFNNYSTGT